MRRIDGIYDIWTIKNNFSSSSRGWMVSLSLKRSYYPASNPGRYSFFLIFFKTWNEACELDMTWVRLIPLLMRPSLTKNSSYWAKRNSEFFIRQVRICGNANQLVYYYNLRKSRKRAIENCRIFWSIFVFFG